MKIRRTLAPALALALLGATPAPSPSSPPAPQPRPDLQVPAGVASSIAGFDHVQAKHIYYNLNSGEYRIPDRFTALRSGTDITADSATGNSKKKTLHAVGHVVVHQNQPLKSSGGDVTKATQEPSTLTCDKLDADGSGKIYVATGNVEFTQANREGSSDSAILDDGHHMLHMQGHVHLRDHDQTLDGDVVDYNTLSGEAEVKGAPALIRLPIETPTPGPPRPKPTPKKRR
jgi:lipopolysaccharide assembly outer membrane protein LptD (OstA)